MQLRRPHGPSSAVRLGRDAATGFNPRTTRLRPVQTSTTPVSVAPTYEEFAAKASGEWEGVTVTFSADGSPEQLPEYYVPAAFRDWGVEVHDWQTHVSTIADQSGVKVAVKRLMPTVGCEADAVAFVEEASNMFQDLLSRNQPATVLADGSYSHGPQVIAGDANKVVAEACLGGQGSGRVRVVQHLMKGWQDGRWFTSKVDLHHEKYDAPYSAGHDIRSCGFSMENIALKPKAAAEQLGGSWGEAAGTRYTMTYGASSEPSVATEAIAGGSLLPSQVEEQQLGLPLGAWCGVSQSEGELWATAGVLTHEGAGRALVARRYAEGRLVEVVMGTETKLPS